MHRLAYAGLLAGILLLFACSPRPEAAAPLHVPPTTQETTSAADAKVAAALPPASPDLGLAMPPPAFLVLGEHRQRASLGAYCWRDPFGEACAEQVSSPAAGGSMTIVRGIPVEFSFAEAPSQPLLLRVYVANVPNGNATAGPLLEAHLPATNAVQTAVCLPPGDYTALVSGQWLEGEATYGFAFHVKEYEA